MKAYVVMARRWGEEESHSYICGWSPDFEEAKATAEHEKIQRGGKYACVVYRVERSAGEKSFAEEVYRARSMAE